MVKPDMASHSDDTVDSARLSIDNIVQQIWDIRKERINTLLRTDGLTAFLETHFEVFAISAVKREFLLKDLTELRDSPLDLAYYSSLIIQMKTAPQLELISNNKLVQREIETAFKKFGFVIPG